METAITNAKSHVDATGGLAIIYFLEGTYYINSPNSLNHTYRNIGFQGAGSDRTVLVFKNSANNTCFSFYGTASNWIDLDQDFNKAEKNHASSVGTLSSISVDH